ncbi:uncharacterized protein LOC112127534 [Cimex lectularius]|uniref:Uncharacterized protein n=1 Tax=Cimex lectularius TaxID=79782 RepID=A0A8I6TKS5_CIMLE|nr:uncharacterized protein LOC112127534 [Cimex lectularius]
MRTLVFVLFTFAFACCEPHYSIDEHVDRLLPIVNNFIGVMGWQNVTLPDYGLPSTPVFIGVSMADMATIERTGPCEMWAEGIHSLNLKFTIGLGTMKADIEYVPVMGGPVTLLMEGASAIVGVKFVKENPKKIDCDTKWDYINIQTLGNVTVHTSNKLYDGKILPDTWTNALISYYNRILNLKGEFSISNLDSLFNICNIPDNSTPMN